MQIEKIDSYIAECKKMQEEKSKDKNLQKVYSDINFNQLIYDAEIYKRELLFAQQLFN